MFATAAAAWHTGRRWRGNDARSAASGRVRDHARSRAPGLTVAAGAVAAGLSRPDSADRAPARKLAALLWPDADDDNARSNLRHALWRLRKTIEARLPSGIQYLVADDLAVAFKPNAPYRVDTADLNAAANGSLPFEEVSAALDAYRGELLPGFYDEWVLRERERLEAIFERKVDNLIEHLVANRRWSEVVEWAERWIAVGHAPEPAYRALMLAYSERGDRAHVALAYQRCREALFEELGAQPSEATRALFDKLSRGERVLPIAGEPPEHAPAIQPAAPGDAPFKGLPCFDESDVDLTHGQP